MKSIHKLVLGVVLVIGVVAVVIATANKPTSPSSTQTQKATSPIVVGFSAPLSGDAAAWGEPAKKGAELAVAQINAQGGINGRPLQVIYEDDACDPKQGLSVLQKFLSIDKVDVVAEFGAVLRVGHHDDGGAFIIKMHQVFHHVIPVGAIQVAGRFIGQD